MEYTEKEIELIIKHRGLTIEKKHIKQRIKSVIKYLDKEAPLLLTGDWLDLIIKDLQELKQSDF